MIKWCFSSVVRRSNSQSNHYALLYGSLNTLASAVVRKMDIERLKAMRNNLTPEYPFGGPKRQEVPEDKRLWSTQWAEYNPQDYTSPRVQGKPWADPDLGQEGFAPKWNEEDGLVHRVSWEGPYDIDEDGRPLNPVGRTGMKGRGVLGKWGVNHAADCIVTRWKRDDQGQIVHVNDDPILQFVAITRQDTGDLAIPGGMVEPGEDFVEAARREFLEEVYSSEALDSARLAELKRSTIDVLGSPTDVYKGYIDDRRNTDNAWIETCAINFHINDINDAFNEVPFNAGSDATGASWNDCLPMAMYASHIDLIHSVVEHHDAAWII